MRQYAIPSGKPRKIDDFTVEFVQDKPNPITLEHVATIFIMNRAWAEKNKVERPLIFKEREETYASRNANGTGPFMLVSREPGVKIGAEEAIRPGGARCRPRQHRRDRLLADRLPTRRASPPCCRARSTSSSILRRRTCARLKANKDIKVVEGQENRVIFFGFDQQRDELLYSNVKGKNPFKDATRAASGLPGDRHRGPEGQDHARRRHCPPAASRRRRCRPLRRSRSAVPYRPEAAKKLLAEAGYPNGFEVTLDCPNNRYVNDEEICVAVAAMLSRVGILTKVTALPRATYFPKLEKFDTSFYMLGWGGAITDAQTMLSPVLRSKDDKTGNGSFNYGRYVNPKLDALIDAAAVETDPDKRRQLITGALPSTTSRCTTCRCTGR